MTVILKSIDEMRSSQFFTDFYTNSIGEASSSILEKGDGLINDLPKSFVRQGIKQIIIDKQTRNTSKTGNKNSKLTSPKIPKIILIVTSMIY